jgi:homoserine kinase
LYNFIRVTRRQDAVIQTQGEEVEGTQQMVAHAAAAFFETAGIPAHGLDYEIWGEIPKARGLGSSSTVRAGIIAGLNALNGSLLDTEAMIRLTTRLDKAPDNACAAFVGGFCIARTNPADFSYLEHVRFELPPSLVFIAVSPDYEVLTRDSRRVLPDSIPFKDVVRSANSLAFLVGVLVSGDFERLHGVVNDFIHQPYRELLNPFGRESITAGRNAGAYTGWLSGSGSTVMCVTDDAHAREVGAAMQQVYTQNNLKARICRLSTDNVGLRVIELA